VNKKLTFFIISLLWVAVAVGIISLKQYTLRTGKTIVLETVPVDPRDFLRGDYVILRYKISELDLNQIKSTKSYYHSGENIFVELESKGKFYEAAAVYGKKDIAAGKVILKGKVKYFYNKKLEVDYGIGSYFVPEGEGREIERNMRGSKSSVSAEIVVDSTGSALIKRVYIDN
jgi:uncharacterized membrane-anchored protein